MIERLVVITGTGTGVGKTWVACALIRQLRAKGILVSARKPAQSFDPAEAMNTDAHLLAAASGEDPASVCDPRRWYSAPLAPPIAAASLDQAQFSVADLADELEWPPGIELQVLEGAGGIRSPLAADGDLVDLMWRLPVALVILVSDAGLGAINAVRLAAAATDPFPTIVFLNRFDAENSVHLHNLRWLRENDRLTVMTEAVDLAEFLVDRSDRS